MKKTLGMFIITILLCFVERISATVLFNEIEFSRLNSYEMYRNLEFDDFKDNKRMFDKIMDGYYIKQHRTTRLLCLGRKGIIYDIGRYVFKQIVDKNDIFYRICYSVDNELQYFPVVKYNYISPNDKEVNTDIYNCENEISYDNSWEKDRNYGGLRKHEGTDLMASNNKSGYYMVISMADGVVENKGWLKLGGYRIGIRTDSGVYLYYAHLHSYAQDIEVGDRVMARKLLGFMGDTGYGEEEGTSGKFDVHLHFGYYIKKNEDDVSINPYFFLKYLENNKICYKKYR